MQRALLLMVVTVLLLLPWFVSVEADETMSPPTRATIDAAQLAKTPAQQVHGRAWAQTFEVAAHGAEVFVALVALVSVLAVMKQLWETEKQRHAEMAWKLFEMQSSRQMRKARETLYKVTDNCSTPKDYLEKYFSAPRGTSERKQHIRIRGRLRYFHQAGLLVEKKLVDTDMVFGLVGSGLKQDYQSLQMILEAIRSARSDPGIYDHIEYLYDRYRAWEEARNSRSAKGRTTPEDRPFVTGAPVPPVAMLPPA
jgi:hypothetical protein